ncbi:hypothetical protein F5Y00DRAFT_265301 [Daldinia vernicosa]|uniref:uncharacterized protein n=1 Tax=Daldinia vernicosa TaxID=114800 RepID=UPI00200871EB|nr:uncharacterized protein F5Y00DRAFT_265301 [Daldinia vernicosa]KAI0845668.1 hypothetical protein F5Y00DRAFT_265301 [Daldinia vernicosa]
MKNQMSLEEQMASLELREAIILNGFKTDATPNEIILSAVKKVPTSTSKTNFFSLPLEVRQMIYDEVYITGWDDDGIYDYSQLGLYYHKTSFPNIGLSRVCKQMYSDVTPYIYKKVSVSLPLEDWHKFFYEIGPHNIRHIQEITINYRCSLWGGAWNCWGRDEHKDNYNKWEGIFRSISLGSMKPKKVMVWFDPCDNYSRYEDGTPVDGYQYLRCQVYEDLWFVKGILRCFWQARKIEFRGEFNPLWGHTLRKGLDFILRRDGDDRMALFNPKFICPAVDLKNCTKISDVVYDKIQTPWANLPTW